MWTGNEATPIVWQPLANIFYPRYEWNKICAWILVNILCLIFSIRVLLCVILTSSLDDDDDDENNNNNNNNNNNKLF